MVFHEWIKTEPEATPLTEDRCKSLQEVAWATLLKVKDEIIRGWRWRSSAEVVAAEEEIRENYQAVVVGRGSLQALSAACDKWKRVGTAAQTEKNICPIGEIEQNINDSAKTKCTLVHLGTIPEGQLRPPREKEGELHGSA